MVHVRICREYIEKCLKIRNKQGNIVPFKLNGPQGRLYDQIKELRAQGIPVRIIVLKARQMGFSTLIEAIIFWAAATARNVAGLVMAHQDDATSNIFGMAKRYYDYLPDRLKPMQRASNARELLFASPTGSKGKQRGLDSSIRVSTAGGHGVGRSFTIKVAHLSEFAFWPGDKRDTLAGIMQAVPDEPDTMVFIESTANGFDEFKDIWDNAVSAWERGERDGWCPFFAAWWQMEEYRRPVPPGFVRTAEEEELVRLYDLDDEQLAWRRWCIKINCGGDLDLFRQEYPACPDEAFIASGSCIFDQTAIAAWRQVIKTRAAVTGMSQVYSGSTENRGRFVYEYDGLTVSGITWDPCADGEIVLYKRPVEGVPYVIGADTAGDSGTAWSDFFAAHVLDNTTGEQVAVLHGKMDEDVFARQIYCLGMYYNEALVGVEVNYSTHPVKELTRLQYPRQYTREQTDTYTGALKKAYGFNTNTATRPVIIAELVEAARDNLENIVDDATLAEMLSFAKNDKGRAEALPGKHDDLVMSLAIANHIRPQQSMVVLETPEEPHKKLIDILNAKDRRRRRRA